jgi:hypothetical protein
MASEMMGARDQSRAADGSVMQWSSASIVAPTGAQLECDINIWLCQKGTDVIPSQPLPLSMT